MPIVLSELTVSAEVRRIGPKERVELSDERERGLRLRVGKTGGAWSVLVRDGDGPRCRMSLGAWPDVSVAAARVLARNAKKDAARRRSIGGEPQLLKDLLAIYHRTRLKEQRRGESTFRSLKAGLESIAGRDVRTIKRRDISRAILSIAEGAPVHANRTLAYIKAFFAWLVAHGYLDHNPAKDVAKPTRERSRDRTPALDELVAVWDGALQIGYPFGHITRLLILLACRQDEVAQMRVEELDLPEGEDTGAWTIPSERSKNGRPIRVPLCRLARRLIELSLIEAFPGCGFPSAHPPRPFPKGLLFSTKPGRPVSGWSKAKVRLDAMISNQSQDGRPLEAWRFHDLRRAFATHACDVLHADVAVVDRCLNHVGAATTSTVSRVYSRNEMYEQRRDVLGRWSDLLEAELRAKSIWGSIEVA